MNFTDQDIETIKELLRDHGSDCPGADSDAVQALGEKLGVYQPELPPTAEELKRWEERAKDPMWIVLSQMMSSMNAHLAQSIADDITRDSPFLSALSANSDEKIGSTLRIRLPNDYTVKAE